jgi:hypothetical protein
MTTSLSISDKKANPPGPPKHDPIFGRLNTPNIENVLKSEGISYELITHEDFDFSKLARMRLVANFCVSIYVSKAAYYDYQEDKFFVVIYTYKKTYRDCCICQ